MPISGRRLVFNPKLIFIHINCGSRLNECMKSNDFTGYGTFITVSYQQSITTIECVEPMKFYLKDNIRGKIGSFKEPVGIIW